MRSMDEARKAARLFLAAFRVLIRAFGLTFVVLALASPLVFWWAQRALSPEKVRRLVVEQLQAALNREVRVERVVLSPRGIKVRGLRVPAVRAGSPDDPLVCDSAVVTFKLKPLLRRRVVIDRIRLEAPRITLWRDEAGVWNFADVFTSTASARRSALPVDVASAETFIEAGVLRIEDRLRRRKVSLENLSVRVDELSLERAFPLSLSFVSVVTVGTRTVTTTASADGSVDLAGLAWSSASARAERFTLSAEGAAFAGRLSVDSFERPRLDFDVEAPALGPDAWRRLAGQEWPLSLPAARWTGRAVVGADARVELADLEVRTPAGVARVDGFVDLAASTPTLRADLRVVDADLAALSSWHPRWTERGLKGRGELRAVVFGAPGRLQAESGFVALKGFGGRFGRAKLDGWDLSAEASEEFNLVRATVTAGSAELWGSVFSELAFSAAIRGQDLAVDRLSVRWAESRAKLRFLVQRISDPKEVVVSGSIDKVSWEEAQKLVSGIVAAAREDSGRPPSAPSARPWVRIFKHALPRRFPDTAGRVRVGSVTQANFNCRDVDLVWELRGVTPGLEQVSGDARLSFGPGRVSDVAAVQESNKFLRVVFLPFVYMHKMNNLSVFSAATAYPKTLDFGRIQGEYAVSRGVAHTRWFHVDSPQLAAYAEGTADFAREQVDMNILTRLTSFRGTLPEWWVDEAGRPAIGFRVKGDLNRPDLEPRLSKMSADEIEKALDSGRKRSRPRFTALARLQTL